ncbi:MAG: alpha/beta hydrolase [Rhizobiales bacterium]|nr:alpha/beta hydrolase [Hyphomicrobiales bacterium]
MKTIVINGRVRFFEDEGQGPPVILVHGSLSNAWQWRTLTERLRGRFRVLAPDLYAGEPQGGAPRIGDFSFTEDCAFVQRLIDDAGGSAHLLGHSYGGVVAIKSALERRDRLASLTLIEPSCFHLLDKSGAEYAEIAAIRERERAHFASGDTAGAARFFVDYWMGPAAWPAMPQRRQELIAAGAMRLYQDWRGAFEMNTTLEDYRGFGVRTLLLRARDTRRPSSRLVDLIGAALPNAVTAEIKSGGHMSPLTNPEPVNDAIEKFLMGRL